MQLYEEIIKIPTINYKYSEKRERKQHLPHVK